MGSVLNSFSLDGQLGVCVENQDQAIIIVPPSYPIAFVGNYVCSPHVASVPYHPLVLPPKSNQSCTLLLYQWFSLPSLIRVVLCFCAVSTGVCQSSKSTHGWAEEAGKNEIEEI